MAGSAAPTDQLPPPPMSVLDMNFEQIFQIFTNPTKAVLAQPDRSTRLLACRLWKIEVAKFWKRGALSGSPSPLDKLELLEKWWEREPPEVVTRFVVLCEELQRLFQLEIERRSLSRGRKRVPHKWQPTYWQRQGFQELPFKLWKCDQQSIAQLNTGPQPKPTTKELQKCWTKLSKANKRRWKSKGDEFELACGRFLDEKKKNKITEDHQTQKRDVRVDNMATGVAVAVAGVNMPMPNKAKAAHQAEAVQFLNQDHHHDGHVDMAELDNSMSPFIPRLTSKPNAKKKFVGAVKGEHPYQLEIEEWVEVHSPYYSTPKPPIPPVPLSFSPPLLVVDTDAALDLFMALVTAPTVTELAMDVEHHSEHSFLGHTCILQVSSRSHDFILDWLALGLRLERLNMVLTNPRVLKVFHGSNSDILWLQRDCGLYVVGLFDTYFAAKELGLEEYSLRYLLAKYCDIKISETEKKKWQTADWRRRPLSEQMIKYARQDTHYLLYIYDKMRNALAAERKGGAQLLRTVFQASAALCLQQYEKPGCEPEAFLARLPKLNPSQSKAVVELYKWRDSIARRLNKSTGFIMSSRSLLQLATLLPQSAKEVTVLWKCQWQVTGDDDDGELETDAQQAQVLQILLSAKEEESSESEEQLLETTAMEMWMEKRSGKSEMSPNMKKVDLAKALLVAEWEKLSQEDQRPWRWAARTQLQEKGKKIGATDTQAQANVCPKTATVTVNQLSAQMGGMRLRDIGAAAAELSPAAHFDTMFIKDYRQMSLIPTTAELLSPSNNTLPGGTQSPEHGTVRSYVDTHFRLLREDYVLALKEGVASFRSGNSQQQRPSKARVHADITITKCVLKKDKAKKGEKYKQWSMLLPRHLALSLQADQNGRFLTGQLMLFSSDNFTTIFYGFIEGSSADPWATFKQRGIFTMQVRFLGGDPPWAKSHKFVTLEPDVYFEPYNRVLGALQTKQFEKYPLASYLIRKFNPGDPPPPLPAYLRNALAGKKYSLDGTKVNPLAPSSWPPATQFGLDPVQYEGLKSALTQEIALIQGPPGTGKTYLGVRIVKMLIENQWAWKAATANGGAGGPILVMCYTNHALDQFLGGVLDAFTPREPKTGQLVANYIVRSPKIVRLGMRSTFDRAEPYIWTGEPKKAKADIIFMTTTGGARRAAAIGALRSRIMIVEEAAEVFEAHIVASFTPHLQHLILLGDHQQLKPLTATNSLAGGVHNLDVSLFERLARSNFGRTTLMQQHRMRPVIRDLITGTIYKTLSDHPKVLNYPKHVHGMEKNLYFLDHTHPEVKPRGRGSDHSHSKSNPHEAELVIALAEYLILQGLKASQLVVLATYMAQVKRIKSGMQGRRLLCSSVPVETADSYQGEENDIVLLSLVRSNTAGGGSIGFMKTDNRICVALSRARHGLYIVGNISLLAGASRTWQQIQKKLAVGSNIGTSLPLLICTRHGLRASVETPTQLWQLMDGGCAKCLQELTT